MAIITFPGEPCVRCNTTGGLVRFGSVQPYRTRLDRFGLPGKGCYACYQELVRRAKGIPVKTEPPEPDDPHIEPEEIDRRIGRVRAAKSVKGYPWQRPFLTTEELDQVLPITEATR